MKRYLAYKETNLAWLTAIPEHWEIVRGKNLFKRLSRPVRPEDEIVTAFRDGVVTLRKNRREEGFTNALHEIGYQGVRTGDLVIHAMDGFAGAIGVSDSDGKSTPVYAICQPVSDANPFYFARLLRRMALSGYVQALSRGIRERSTEFRFNQFANLSYPVPPREEQNAIVAFLEAKEAQINKFVAKKRRMIELMKEQKAALINRAVTRGLNPDAPMKPSGIDWLGDIPAHWQQKPAKYYFKEIDIRSETGSEELLSVSHITGVTPRSEKNITMFMAESYEGSKLCEPGDLVINIMWAWMGAMGMSKYKGIVSPSYGVYRLKDSGVFNQDYLDNLLRTKAYIAEYTCRSTGVRSSRLRLYTDEFFCIPILKPPIEEQNQIAALIQKQHHATEKAIDEVEREITLIEEYRASLIDAAVTGKIDLRLEAASAVEI